MGSGARGSGDGAGMGVQLGVGVGVGVASSTRTKKSALALLPEASVAVLFTVVAPIGNRLPDAGTDTTIGFGSRLSDAVTT